MTRDTTNRMLAVIVGLTLMLMTVPPAAADHLDCVTHPGGCPDAVIHHGLGCPEDTPKDQCAEDAVGTIVDAVFCFLKNGVLDWPGTCFNDDPCPNCLP